jgi:beta-lactamase superfamily II metal-dependent hydrolase
VLRVDALPAGFGDCLWIEWGTGADRPVILIDGGLKATAETIRERVRVAQQERTVKRLVIRLFVITHIDRDHIDGALEFLKDPQVPVDFTEIWFNGRPQLARAKLARTDLLGVVAGEHLSELLLRSFAPSWNSWCEGKAVVVPAKGPLPQYDLDAHASLTLLGPTPERLKRLTQTWEEVVGELTADAVKRPDLLGGEPTAESVESERADLLGKAEMWPPVWGEYTQPDNTPANGSSIALVLEVEGHRLLLSGDAYSEDLEAALRRFVTPDHDGRIAFDLVKLPHHGSERNFSPGLAQLFDSDRYLFSTNCRTHRHPNFATILRIIRHSPRRPRLQFNYEADKTICWRDRRSDLAPEFSRFDTDYPERSAPWGLRNEWS